MSKKITKTILLIVFVVFLGINKVDAKDDNTSIAKTCVYDSNIVISIDPSYGTAKKEIGDFKNIINWSKEIKGFSGYDYFINNGKQCPPMVILADYTFGKDDVYFTDEDHKSDIKKYAEDKANVWGDDYYFYNLISQSDGAGAHGDKSEDTPGVTTTTNKKCTCSGDVDGLTASLTYKVNDNRDAGRITIKVGEKTNEEPILNWSEGYSHGVWPFKETNSYTFLDQYSKDNSCSEYAVIKKTGLGAYHVVLSDSSNLEDLKRLVGKYRTNSTGTVFTLSCKDTTVPTNSNNNSSNSNASSNATSNTTSNASSNTSSNSNNEYDDPTINSNVKNLNYDLSTYSCGHKLMTDIPVSVPKIGRFIYNFIQFLIPLVLIILGSIDLIKAIVGQKEDEIKKGQQTFTKRLIGAVLIFFVFAIVKFVVSILATDSSDILSCVDCILRFSDKCVSED